MRRRELLVLDGIGNVALGVLLLVMPFRLAAGLGIVETGSRFYPTLFGAVLFGIGVALLMESRRNGIQAKGLGLYGALAINTSFGVALGGWLLFGELRLPLHGAVILWSFVLVLLGLSGVELSAELRSQTA